MGQGRIATIDAFIGNTPLVPLQRLYRGPNVVLCKLEGLNPAGSIKDRPAFSMIQRARERGRIHPGDRLIEATSGNTGIALAMASAILGYRMTLVMPENQSLERRNVMRAYGATLVLTSEQGGMEEAIDVVRTMEERGKGVVLDQFANSDNPLSHYQGTGPEIWRDTNGRVTHFVASTGTTGTLMGVSRYLKEQNPAIQIVAVTPARGECISGIRAWPQEYMPAIFDPRQLDSRRVVSREVAERTTRALARSEGLFAGISSGGNVATAIKLASELENNGVHNAVIATILCDSGERYLSTRIFRI